MAKVKSSLSGKVTYIPGPPKKSRQGTGSGTKYSASSRNGARKKYRGQGKRQCIIQIVMMNGIIYTLMIFGYTINYS